MKRNRIISFLLVLWMGFGFTSISVNAEEVVNPPTPTIALALDTGLNNDRITSDGTVNIGNLVDGAFCEYSINSGISWNVCTENKFILVDGTYPIETVKVRQTVGGLTSSSVSNVDEWVIAKNQVQNGDFQQGNVGFYTSYTFSSIPDIGAGKYAIVTKANDVHSAWTNVWDKTLNTDQGKYFVANGSNNAADVVWQSNDGITVKANEPYRFEANLMSLIGAAGDESVIFQHYPRVKFQLGDGINWEDMGTTAVNWSSGESGIWHLIYIDGKFSKEGTYYIRLLNMNTDPGGYNDLGVDDIYFGLRGAAPSALDENTNPTAEPPSFDTTNFFSMALENDTGMSNLDQITANGQVNLSSVQTIWEYSTNDGGDWTVGIGNDFILTGDGYKSVIVRQRVNIGDPWSSNSAPLEFELDNTAPIVESAVVSDKIITLDNNEILDSNNIPSVTDFSVNVDGGAAIEPISLNISSDKITLTLPNRVVNGQTVSITYTNPGDNGAIQDIAGNKSVSLNSYAVTNNTITISYNANNASLGSVPNSQNKTNGLDLTLSTNSGDLARTDYTFAGWNTQANGSGENYAEGGNYSQDESITLYAKWNINAPIDIAEIPGVTMPVRGTAPVTTITETAQFTGTVSWSPVEDPFGASTLYTATITITPKVGFTLTGVAENFFTVEGTTTPATNSENAGVVTAVFPSTDPDPDDGGDGGSQETTLPRKLVIVIINGKEVNAGIELKTMENNKSIVTIEVNNLIIESRIDEAINNNPTGINNRIQVPVVYTNSAVVKVEFTGDIVKKLEDNNFYVSVKKDNIEYIIPAKEFTISKVAGDLGILEKDLYRIKVEVKISNVDEKVVDKYNENAKVNGAELVFPPVEFKIFAKATRVDATVEAIEISKFSNFVERILEIPAVIDPNMITTGIVFNQDGTYNHVPTVIFHKDGKWYTKLYSLTNSNYSVVWNPVIVKSVENHWSKDAVNEMASRLVISNPESFDPNKTITRAELVECIVRALGLYRYGSIQENKFKDVSETGYRNLAIHIAYEYGIVTGYPDGNFRPDKQITREEAMTMYARAMKVANLVGIDQNRYQSYDDFIQVGSWATTYVKEVLSAHVFVGTAATTISPKSYLTFAEAAQAIKNLLVESKLINE